MFGNEALHEAPDFSGSAGIELFTQRDKVVPLFLVYPNDKLTVFLGFSGLFFRHHTTKRLYVIPYTYIRLVVVLGQLNNAFSSCYCWEKVEIESVWSRFSSVHALQNLMKC